MKIMTARFLLASSAAVLAVYLTGCKKEEPRMPTTSDAQKAASDTQNAADAALKKVDDN